MTRGRTGSTAVMDSLNKTSSITTAQELFIKHKANKKNSQLVNQSDRVILRYDPWREQNLGRLERVSDWLMRNGTSIVKYLDYVESTVSKTDAKAFGFKVISHHLKQRPGLQNILINRGYAIIYLTRNITRQVISGMVAKKKGKYNAHENENYKNNSTFTIDIDNYVSLVGKEKRAQQDELESLKLSGLDYTVITYDDFVSNRDQLFLDIVSFLKLEPETAPESSYMIMIESLKDTIKNYDQVCDATKQLGMTLE
jgi:LPS sulfotransferase NodH